MSTETQIVETPNNTPMTFYTDRVRMPDIPENSRGEYEIKPNTLSPKYTEHQSIVFYNTAMRTAIEQVKAYPPETVGDLWAKYLYLVAQHAQVNKSLNGLVSGLSVVNEKMNEYADDNNFCSSYEEALSDFNRALYEAGYSGYFEFTGREEEVQVTVRRQRTVLEEVTVSMTRMRDAEIDEDTAQELADEMDTWTEIDYDYNTDYYEVTDVSSF
jgi:hypothetical protein